MVTDDNEIAGFRSPGIITVMDGSFNLGPGSILLVEDTTGKGHVSRVVGNERVLLAAVPLVEL